MGSRPGHSQRLQNYRHCPASTTKVSSNITRPTEQNQLSTCSATTATLEEVEMCKEACRLRALVLVLLLLIAQEAAGLGIPVRPITSSARRANHEMWETGRSCGVTTKLRSEPGRTIELENEEPLSVIFQRAVVLQRAGSPDEALKEYELFLKAARQCQVDPSQYAEVHINMGAIYLRKATADCVPMAKEQFEKALEHRPIGTAHINLAALALREASQSTDREEGLECIQRAKAHCETVLELNQDRQSIEMAYRLLKDINRMMG